jgi:hypothetical protein
VEVEGAAEGKVGKGQEGKEKIGGENRIKQMVERKESGVRES